MIDDIQAELVQTQLVLDGVLRAPKEGLLQFVVGARTRSASGLP